MKRKMLSLLLLLTLLYSLLCALPAHAEGNNETPLIPISGTSFSYLFDEKSGTLTIRGKGDMPVFAADSRPWLSRLAEIKTLVINDGVTSISDGAFAGCTALESASLPDSLVSIGSEAFSGCESLARLTLFRNLTEIGENAFSGCAKLEQLTLDSACVKNWFAGLSPLKTLTFGSHVRVIEESAFAACENLETISLPDTVERIGEKAFDGTKFAADTKNRTGGLLYCKNWLLAADSDISKATLKAGTVGIADSAFNGCAPLETLTLPSSLRNIGANAFENCMTLKSITLPENVESIGRDAFKHTGYAEEHKDESLLYLGNWLIAAASDLETANIKTSTVGIADAVFEDHAALSGVSFQDTRAASAASELRYFGARSFAGCSGLTGMPIPDGTVRIGEEAFFDASGLTELVLPYTVKRIDRDAFSNCFGLATLKVYNSACEIDPSRYTLGVPGMTELLGWKDSTTEAYAPIEPAYAFVQLAPKDYCEKHNWGAWVIETEAKCEAKGSQTRTCQHCSFSEISAIDALGHKWGDWTNVTAATCTEAGSHTHTCSRCDKKVTESINALGHDWNAASYTWSTDNKTVTATRTCKRNAQHTETKSATATSQCSATCTVAGKTTYTALFADGSGFESQTKTVDAAALGHLDANNDGKCDRCGTKLDTSSTSPETGAATLTPILIVLLGILGIAVFCKKQHS